jgi:hypothetical protein
MKPHYKTTLTGCALAAVLICFALTATAQQQKISLLEKSVTRLNLNVLGASVTHEMRTGRKTTVLLEGGVRVFIQRLRGTSDTYTATPLPGLSAEARFYYNLDKRAAQGRSTQYNRGGFVGLDAGYLFNPGIKKNVLLKDTPFTSLFWGLQGKVATKLNVELKAGWGLMRTATSNNLTPVRLISLRFGFIIANNP